MQGQRSGQGDIGVGGTEGSGGGWDVRAGGGRSCLRLVGESRLTGRAGGGTVGVRSHGGYRVPLLGARRALRRDGSQQYGGATAHVNE